MILKTTNPGQWPGCFAFYNFNKSDLARLVLHYFHTGIRNASINHENLIKTHSENPDN